jgi:hypothetical protein
MWDGVTALLLHGVYNPAISQPSHNSSVSQVHVTEKHSLQEQPLRSGFNLGRRIPTTTFILENHCQPFQ